MNLADGVQSFCDGLCDGFRRKIWQRGTYLVLKERGELSFPDNAYIPYSCDFLADDYELVNPKPQTETKEVTAWASVDSTNGRVWSIGTKERMEIMTSPDSTNLIKIVELTGTYEMPVKPKVKRREEIPITCVSITRTDLPTNGNCKFYAEWEE
jgi:hypothetical protein